MATISVANAHLWVHDQDEALEFWTEKVGFEVRQDITMAGTRRLPLALGGARLDRTSRSP